MSDGNETSDMMTTINPIIPVLAQGLKTWGYISRYFVTKALGYFDSEQLFLTRPVHEVIWGYEDPLLGYLKAANPYMYPISNVGYFMRRNFTHDGVYTVHTGADNVADIGKVSHHNGRTELDIWTTKWANMINGTDGSSGPPFSFNMTSSAVFVSDICRSIQGVYKKDVQVKGIRLRRFGGDPYDMENATVNPDNIGFCTPAGTPKDKCLPAGLINSTLCQEPIDGFRLPAIFSFPHFLNADKSVQNSVLGLSPNKEEHQTIIDMEPWTGMVLQVAKRLQINIFVEKVDFLPQTRNVSTLFFPIMWLNESSVTNDKYADMLKNQLFKPKKLAESARLPLAVSGGVVSLLFLTFIIVHRIARRKFKYAKASTELTDFLDML